MIDKAKIAKLQSEPLMDLLIAQCSDLEALLALARRENRAAGADDFGEVFAVAQERATLGNRLETYHRQITELRAQLGPSAADLVGTTVARETVRLAMEIQAQDQQTGSLLWAARTRTSHAILQLHHKHRNTMAYLHGAPSSGLHCNRRA